MTVENSQDSSCTVEYAHGNLCWSVENSLNPCCTVEYVHGNLCVSLGECMYWGVYVSLGDPAGA